MSKTVNTAAPDQGAAPEEKGRTAVRIAVIAAVILVVIMSVCIIVSDVKKQNAVKAAEAEAQARQEMIESGAPIPVDMGFGMLFDSITQQIEAGRYAEAAADVIRNVTGIQDLFVNTCGQRPYYYVGDNVLYAMKDATVDKALVFTNVTTMFYGSFVNGLPDGECLAIRTYYVGTRPRYDYAVGNWTAGKRNGEGNTGFAYMDYGNEAEDVAEDAVYVTDKFADFKDDVMDGKVGIRVTTKQSSSDYLCTISDGTLQIDDVWAIDEDAGTYKMYAQTGEAYSVDAENFQNEVWENMVKWTPVESWE